MVQTHLYKNTASIVAYLKKIKLELTRFTHGRALGFPELQECSNFLLSYEHK